MEIEEDSDAVEYDQLLPCELEAVECLAGLARCSDESELPRHRAESVLTSSRPSQDQGISVQQFCSSTMISSPAENEQTVETMPCHSCSRNCRSNSSKLRKKLTEAEKEEQRVRRVLANRESARQTIRRRQDIYQELTRKASDMSEENENLTTEKELVMNAYTSLKARNEFLKAQMAKIKKAKQVEIQETESSRAHISSTDSTSHPIFTHNQPLFPFFLPFPLGEQENSMGILRPNTPLYVLPVPWLLPFFTHGKDNMCNTCSSSETMPCENLASNSTRATVLPYGGPFESLEPTKKFWKDDICGVNDVSAPEKMTCNLEAVIRSRKRSEDAVSAATEARRRRNELNKLKKY